MEVVVLLEFAETMLLLLCRDMDRLIGGLLGLLFLLYLLALGGISGEA